MKTPILNLSIIIDLLEIIIHIDIINCCSRHIFFPELFEPVRFPVRRVKAHEGTVVEERERLVDLLERDDCYHFDGVYIYMWVNYNISLTWNKAILGMIPLTNYDYSEVGVRSL